MMDNSRQMAAIWEMVEAGYYFTIYRPRQYGKTTSLQFLEEKLEPMESYLPISMNFQEVDEQWYISDQAFAQMIIEEMYKASKYLYPEVYSFLSERKSKIKDMNTLSEFITEFVHWSPYKIVLLIDEVDASSNYQPVLSFLGVLRAKYLAKTKTRYATFHSVVLIGVHDIKSLKYKLRDPDSTQYNSPWNISADFDVEMGFLPKEIEPMLVAYSQAEQIKLDHVRIAERLFYHTSGYPFLISKLCKIIAEKMLPKHEKKEWLLTDVDEAARLILREDNTNFDSLINNLENHPKLYQIAYRIIINGESVPDNPDEKVLSLGRIYGVFRLNGKIQIHNRVYEQRIYNYMIAKTIVNSPQIGDYSYHFQLDNNALDMPAALRKFQAFMKAEENTKNAAFLEAQGRLVFLAFLNPILNGEGHAFKEVQASMEKRLDVVVTYFQHKYVIELKRWYGEKAHAKGLDQFAAYLASWNLDKGYLLIFDGRKDKGWQEEWIQHRGKEIFAIWV